METDLICSPLIGADNELQNMFVQMQNNEALKGESAQRDANTKTRMMERKRAISKANKIDSHEICHNSVKSDEGKGSNLIQQATKWKRRAQNK